MALEHVSFACRACGLHVDADIGQPPGAAAISDAQGDGAYFRAFWCDRDREARVLDVESPRFNGRCPSCSRQLTLLADFPLDACPRCHAPADVDKTPAFGTQASSVRGTGR